MCGILGVVSADHPVAPEAIVDGLEAMAHRGPDGQGHWHRRAGAPPWVSLGHCRLAIIDLTEMGAQPMASNDGVAVLTYNGEIYNYQELRAELRTLGYEFQSQSDTEVLLHAYRHWGEDCLSRLNGMFAFAVWNEAKRELFAARDRFGEKPFHYVFDPSMHFFAFASEMKGLFAGGFASPVLSDPALQRLADGAFLDGSDDTIYRCVRRLRAARALRVTSKNGRLELREWTYWQSGYRSDKLPQGHQNPVHTFRELFEDSIRLRLRSDVPVGTSLSGGLDSSAVLCTIKQVGVAIGQRAFSARMTDPRLDEGKHIHRVLNHTGIPGYSVVPTHQKLQRHFPQICFHMEEPFPATSMFAQFLVMQLAKEHGVTVLLDGQGADELLGGYDNYFHLRYGDMARHSNFIALRRELRSYSGLRDGERAMTAKGIAAALLPPSFYDRWRSFRSGGGSMRWWNADWKFPRRDSVEAGQFQPYFSRFRARLQHDSHSGPLQALLRFGDRNSMAWSRELRQPFLDHRLAEFLSTLSDDWKISNGMTKVILRQAMKGVVPSEILNRTDKLGYQAPLGQWLSQELRVWTEERLDHAEQILEGRTASGLVDRFRRLTLPLNDWQEARHLFQLLTLAECISQMREVSARSRFLPTWGVVPASQDPRVAAAIT